MPEPYATLPPLADVPTRKFRRHKAAHGRCPTRKGVLGWTLDAFRLLLGVFALTAIAKEFHDYAAEIALSITFTMMFRPVCAVSWTDGRSLRPPPALDARPCRLRVSKCSRLRDIVSLPSSAGALSASAWAESGRGASLAMEKFAQVRGFLSGLPPAGLRSRLPSGGRLLLIRLSRWGWRPMFSLEDMHALIGLSSAQSKESRGCGRRLSN